MSLLKNQGKIVVVGRSSKVGCVVVGGGGRVQNLIIFISVLYLYHNSNDIYYVDNGIRTYLIRIEVVFVSQDQRRNVKSLWKDPFTESCQTANLSVQKKYTIQ